MGAHGAGGGGVDLDGDFVGLEFDDGLVGGDRLAGLFEPAGDGRGGDAFAEGGDFEGDGQWGTFKGRPGALPLDPAKGEPLEPIT